MFEWNKKCFVKGIFDKKSGGRNLKKQLYEEHISSLKKLLKILKLLTPNPSMVGHPCVIEIKIFI